MGSQAIFPRLAASWRADRQSWKCDLECGGVRLELFSFPASSPRPSRPEACGLRHLAFAVDSVARAVEHLQRHGIATETVRTAPAVAARP
jgi:glyoxylase I family protein